eukprot:Skav215165  [mRNA]  locus=scaffold4093:58217:69934:- [translate_table: standard]
MSSKGNGSSVQLPPTAGVSTADTAEEDVQRYASQEPLRSAVSSGRVASLFNCWHGASPSQAASQIDMAVIWVHKAAKGSNQWSDEGTQRQIAHYRVRKKMKPLTMLIKTIYLGLAFFEVPSWCLNHNVSTCLEHRDSWGIPELPFQDGEAGIDQARWMDFFTSYAAAAGKIGSHRDAQFVKQQAQQSFEALDSDGSGMITGEEFKLVVHVLSDPQVYIPLRPIPEVGSTAWGKRMRRLFTDGVPAWGNHRIPWWVLIDLVVLVEISLAFVQTCLFIAPAGAEFNDQPLQAGSIWFRLLSCTTVIFLFDPGQGCFLLFLVFYVFATIGVQIFGGQIYKGNPKLNGSAFAQGAVPGGETRFCLMVVNNWFVVADGFLRVTNNAAAIFFVPRCEAWGQPPGAALMLFMKELLVLQPMACYSHQCQPEIHKATSRWISKARVAWDS